MDIKPGIKKAALTLTAIIATSLMPNQSRADWGIGFGAIGACQPGDYWRYEEPVYHRVQKGENLWTITKQYNEGKVVGPDEQGKQVHYPTLMAAANHLKSSDCIYPGQRLVVPWKKRVYGCF